MHCLLTAVHDRQIVFESNRLPPGEAEQLLSARRGPRLSKSSRAPLPPEQRRARVAQGLPAPSPRMQPGAHKMALAVREPKFSWARCGVRVSDPAGRSS